MKIPKSQTKESNEPRNRKRSIDPPQHEQIKQNSYTVTGSSSFLLRTHRRNRTPYPRYLSHTLRCTKFPQKLVCCPFPLPFIENKKRAISHGTKPWHDILRLQAASPFLILYKTLGLLYKTYDIDHISYFIPTLIVTAVYHFQ